MGLLAFFTPFLISSTSMIDTTGRLGRENMVTLVIRMAVPIMLSMALQAVYNIADSLFLSRYSLSAFAGVSVIQPFTQIIIAIAIGLGTGLAGVLSNSLGRKDEKSAFSSIHSATYLALVVSIFFLVVMEVFSSPFVHFFVDDRDTYIAGNEYLRLFALGLPFVFLMNNFASILQSHSQSRQAMMVQSSGCLVNIILDPLFIFTFDLGSLGAALATVIGFLVSTILGYVLVRRLELGKGSFSFALIKRIVYIGLPTLLVSGAGPIISIVYNKLVLQYGVEAMVAYGMYLKMESFMFLSAGGVSSALVVIAAYNLGEGKIDRIHSAYRVSLVIGWGTMLLGFLVFQVFTGFFVRLFATEGGTLYALGILAFHYLSFCFLISPFNIITSGLFQGLGQGFRGMAIIATRFFVFLIPYSFILSHFFGLRGLFLSYFAADLTNCLHIYIQKRMAFKNLEV